MKKIFISIFTILLVVMVMLLLGNISDLKATINYDSIEIIEEDTGPVLIHSADGSYYQEINDGVNEYKITYKYLNDNTHKYIIISDFKCESNTTFELNLPDIVIINSKKYPVVGINENVFCDAPIKSIKVGKYVKEIKDAAFKDCISLTKAELPDTLELLGTEVFSGCTSLTEVNIPSSIKEIPDSCFSNTGLKSLKLNDNIETIGEKAFYKSRLVVINLGKNVKTIKDKAFAWETDNAPLKYIYFEGAAPQCGNDLFGINKSVKIYHSSNTSGWDTDCVALSKEGIWQTFKAIDSWDVEEKTNNFLYFNNEKIILDSKDNTKLIRISYDYQGVYYKLYVDKNENDEYYAKVTSSSCILKDIIIPDEVVYDNKIYKVIEVEEYSFFNCIIKNITFGKNITNFGASIFNSVEHPDTILVKNVNKVDIKSNSFPENLTTKIIVENPYYENEGNVKENYYINHTLEDGFDKQGIYYSIDKENGYAIVGAINDADDDQTPNTSQYKGDGYYSGEFGTAIIPDYVLAGETYYPVRQLSRYSFFGSKVLEKIKLGSFIGIDIEDEGITDSSLRDCMKLNDFIIDKKNNLYTVIDKVLYKNDSTVIDGVTIYKPTKALKAGIEISEYETPETVFGFENYSFSNCVNLNKIMFNSGTEIIGEHAFENTGLNGELDLTNVEVVGNNAFSNCYKIKKVTIGNDTELGKYVFRNCYSIEKFISHSDKYVVKNDVLYEISNNKDYAVLLQYPAAKKVSTNEEFIINTLEEYNLPINHIEAYAFAYSKLHKITTGENVYIIGKAAFENCHNLSEVSIGKNVAYIGMEIKDVNSDQFNLKDEIAKVSNVDNPIRSYQVYEQEVFDNCYVLKYIDVNEENLYYYRDSNGILYDKERTTLLLYPQGITRVTYTIPISVKKIALEAMENNTHIKRLIVSENVTEIGAKAFNGCTSLGWIYFRTIYAPIINDQTFNSTGALSENGLEIFCIPEKEAWYYDKDYLWENMNISKYNAIQVLPNQNTEDIDIYTLKVTDTDGNDLANKKVQILSNGKTREGLTDSEGYFYFSTPDIEALYEGTSICLKIVDYDGIYYDYYVEKYPLDLYNGYSSIQMISKPTIKGLLCDGENIESTKIIINTAYYCDGEKVVGNEIKFKDNMVITVKGTWDKEDPLINVIIVDQNDESIISYKLENDVINPSVIYNSKDNTFVFNIHPSLLSENDSYLRVKLITELQEIEDDLNIKTFFYDYFEYGLNLDLKADGVDISFGDDIPFLNALSIGIEFDEFKFPIRFETLRDGVLIGINWDFDLWNKGKNELAPKTFGETLNKFNEYKGALKEKAYKHKELIESSTTHEIKFNASGIIEVHKTGRDDPMKYTGTYFIGTFTYKFQCGKTWFLWYIPVRVEFTFTANGSFGIDINILDYDTQKSFFENCPIEFVIDLEADIKAGIGFSMLSAGIYGTVGLEIFMELSDNFYFNKGILSLDCGIYAKLDLGLVKLSAKFSALKLFGVNGEIVLFARQKDGSYKFWYQEVRRKGSGTQIVESEMYDSIESALNNAILSYDNVFKPSDYNNYKLYGGAEPVVLEYNNELYRFYIDNVYLNSIYDNYNYDMYNYLQLVYSKYNKTTDTWSYPSIVSDANINNITEFDYVVNDDGIHIVYRETNIKIDETNCDKYAESLDIKYIKFDGSTFTDPIKLSDSNNYLLNLDIKDLNGDIFVAWQENSDLNPLGISNDYTEEDGFIKYNNTEANSVIVKKLVNDEFKEIYNGNGFGVLTGLELSMLNNNPYLSIISDYDDNLSTNDDRSILILDLLKENSKFSNLFTSDELKKSVFNTIKFYNSTLYYTDNNKLYRITYLNNEYQITELFTGVVDEYELIFNEENELYGLIQLQYASKSDYNSNLYMALYQDEKFSELVQITTCVDLQMIQSFNYHWFNNKLYVDFSMANVTLDDEFGEELPEEIYTYVDLNECTFDVNKANDLIINSVIGDYDNITNNEEFTLEISVTNNSLVTINSIRTYLTDTNYADVNLTLLPGQTSTIEPKFIVSEFIKTYNIKVEALEDFNEPNELLENNVLETQIAYPDLFINTKYISLAGVDYILVYLSNNGNLATDGGTIYITDGTPDVDSKDIHDYDLYSLDFDQLNISDHIQYMIEVNKYYFKDQYVTVYIESNDTEYDTLNNSSVTILGDRDTDLDILMYTITYYIDGKVDKVEFYEMGEEIKLYTPEDKDGYSFVGWSDSNDLITMPNYNISLYGQYNKNSYTVTYVIDNEEVFVDTYLYDDSIIMRTPENITGYTFEGWNEIKTEDGITIDNVEKMPNYDIVIYGSYRINTYALTYYVDGVEYQTIDEVEYNCPITLPNYTKDGYTFNGWDTTITNMPAYNLIINGTTTINTYTLTYKVNGPNNYNKDFVFDYQFNSYIPTFNFVPETGYKFVSWDNNITKMPNNDVIINGTVELIDYKLTYIVDDEMFEYTYNYGDQIIPLQYTPEDGHTFIEWINLPTLMPDHDLKVYANIETNIYKLIYYIDGIANEEQIYLSYGSAINLNPYPTKVGYTFNGWKIFKDGNGDVISLPNTMPNHDIHIYGEFSINKHQLSYYINGKEYKTIDNIPYGTKLIPEIFEEEGYTFKGWSKHPTTMPDHDIVINGTKEPNVYKIIYNIMYANINEQITLEYLYDSIIKPYEYDPQIGYTFKGWDETLPEKMPSNDISINAIIEEKEYQITYFIEGKEYKQSYKYNDIIVPYEYASEETGMEFVGWNGLPEKMPSYDLFITGTIIPKEYQLILYVNNQQFVAKTYKFNELIVLEDVLDLYGHEFAGWYDENNSSNILNKMPARDYKLYGKYVPNIHTVKFIIDDNVVKEESVEYGKSIIYPSNPTKTGHTFTGWSLNLDSMIDSDITIEANFEPNKHTISYQFLGKIEVLGEYAYGDKVELLPLYKENYEFNGWLLNDELINELIITDNILLVADLKPVVNYNINKIVTISLISISSFIFIGLLFVKFKKKTIKF